MPFMLFLVAQINKTIMFQDLKTTINFEIILKVLAAGKEKGQYLCQQFTVLPCPCLLK